MKNVTELFIGWLLIAALVSVVASLLIVMAWPK